MSFLFFKKKVSGKDLYIEGLNLLLENKKDEALKVLKECVKKESDFAEAYYHIGNIFREKNNIEGALKLHHELLVRPNLDKNIQLKVKKALADDYLKAEKYKKAESIFLDLEKHTKDLKIKELLLFVFEKLEKWDKAIEYKISLNKSKKNNDNSIIASYYIQSGYSKINKNNKAARIDFKEAIKMDPTNPFSYIFIADTYFEEQRIEEALSFWSKIFQDLPSKAYLIFDKIEKYYFNVGQYGEVGRIYSGLVEKEPNNTEALIAMSKYLFKKGDTDEALKYCERALKADPKSRFGYHTILKQLIANDNNINKSLKNIFNSMFDEFPAKKRFLCKYCMNRNYEPSWRCPSCKAWNPYDL